MISLLNTLGFVTLVLMSQPEQFLFHATLRPAAQWVRPKLSYFQGLKVEGNLPRIVEGILEGNFSNELYVREGALISAYNHSFFVFQALDFISNERPTLIYSSCVETTRPNLTSRASNPIYDFRLWFIPCAGPGIKPSIGRHSYLERRGLTGVHNRNVNGPPKFCYTGSSGNHFDVGSGLALSELSLLSESPNKSTKSPDAYKQADDAGNNDEKGPFRHFLLGLEIILTALFGSFGLALSRRAGKPFSGEESSAPPLDIFFRYTFLGLACISAFALMVQPIRHKNKNEKCNNT